MSIQTKLLIIGGIFIVLIMLLRPNPYRDAMEARLAADRGKDKFIRSMEKFTSDDPKERERFKLELESNERENSEGLGAFFGTRSAPAAPAEPAKELSVDPNDSGVDYRKRGSGVGSDGRSNPYASPYGDRQTATPISPPVSVQPQQETRQGGGYYPPAADTPAVRGPARPIFFEGTMAYTTDSTGNSVPMPDGIYRLGNGRTITISNGRKIAPND